MKTVRTLALYLLTMAVFLGLDFLWLGVVAPDFYDRHLDSFLADEVRVAPALLFYLIFVSGLLVFAVFPALRSGSPGRALGLGALLGLVSYSTFELTCYALFSGYPGLLVVVDLAWGTCLAAVVAISSFFLGRWLGLERAGR